MKTLKMSAVIFFAAMLTLTSCKKDKTENEVETSFELTTDGAISDNLMEDVSDVKDEALIDKDLMGTFGPTGTAGTNNLLSCATVTVTPATGFPKTIVIDFGLGCLSNGVFRKGKIQIVLSDSLRRTGSTAVTTFDNYYVNQYKVEGTITWTNTSTANARGWRREVVNGKITAPDGRYWLHNGIKNILQTAGYSTPRNLLDDVFSITGSGSVTNAAGRTRTSAIINALQKKVICENIDRGTIRFEGPNHFAVLDFGNGDCDRIATISIDGNPPRTILLR